MHEPLILARGPIVGRPSRWAADLALAGAALPLTSLAPAALVGFAAWPLFAPVDLAALSLTTAAFGGLLGLLTPSALSALRKNVPLWLIALLALNVSTASMMFAALLADAPSHVALLWVLLGALFGALWLPYLVATALGRSTLPIVAFGLAASSALGTLLVGVRSLM